MLSVLANKVVGLFSFISPWPSQWKHHYHHHYHLITWRLLIAYWSTSLTIYIYLKKKDWASFSEATREYISHPMDQRKTTNKLTKCCDHGTEILKADQGPLLFLGRGNPTKIIWLSRKVGWKLSRQPINLIMPQDHSTILSLQKTILLGVLNNGKYRI